MKKTNLLALPAIALIVFASCNAHAESESKTKPGETPVAVATPVADLATLENTHWRLIDLCGKPMPADAGVTLSFLPESQITGRAAVNRYSGGFRVVDGVLKSGPFITTRMAGPPEAMEREQAYLAAIGAAKSVAKTAAGELVVTVEGKEHPLRFAAAEQR
jgi:heat shock protein HslJ